MSAESPSEKCRAGNLPRLLVVGCGNPLAGDDSAGVEVVQRLTQTRQPAGCEFCTLTSDAVPMLERVSSVDVILLVDAVISGAAPGTLHLIPLPSLDVEPRAMSSLSTHGWGLLETLKLARALGRPIPRVLLLGVESGDVSPGAQRSAAVERSLGLVVQRFSLLPPLLADADSYVWRSARHFPPDDESFPVNG